MAILNKFEQQPNEVLDYDVDFSEYFGATDLIAAGIVTADQGISLGATVLSSNVIKQWIYGGISGSKYKITFKATSNSGRVKEAEIIIKIKEA